MTSDAIVSLVFFSIITMLLLMFAMIFADNDNNVISSETYKVEFMDFDISSNNLKE